MTAIRTGRTVEAVLETALFDHVNQTRRDLWRYRTFAPDGTIAEEEALELSLSGQSGTGTCGSITTSG